MEDISVNLKITHGGSHILHIPPGKLVKVRNNLAAGKDIEINGQTYKVSKGSLYVPKGDNLFRYEADVEETIKRLDEAIKQNGL